MLLICYSFLFSYMFFFSICIAPAINKLLDKKNSSKLLRNIFPKNFKYGGSISVITVAVSFYFESIHNMIFSAIIFLLFLVNLYYILPKINSAADKIAEQKKFSRDFKTYHFSSVFIYLIQMILALSGIFYNI